ncbi:hypothetical protein VB636_18610 [Paracoccus sp. APAP_BH8]
MREAAEIAKTTGSPCSRPAGDMVRQKLAMRPASRASSSASMISTGSPVSRRIMRRKSSPPSMSA